MAGDGVNDVLALKESRLAMGNGSQMAKGVADLVLLTNEFSTVPGAIGEGRRSCAKRTVLLACSSSRACTRRSSWRRSVWPRSPTRSSLAISRSSRPSRWGCPRSSRARSERRGSSREAWCVRSRDSCCRSAPSAQRSSQRRTSSRVGCSNGGVWGIVAGAAAVAIGGVSVSWLRSFFALARPGLVDWLVIAGAGMPGAASSHSCGGILDGL
jgi:hypothetical protein